MLGKRDTTLLLLSLSFTLLCTLCSTLLSQVTSTTIQSSADPSLDDILVRLQKNLIRYKTTVPNFFCDEHVVSELHASGRPFIYTVTDSTFRLERSDASPLELKESREIKLINKKPETAQTLKGPAIFTGAFSDALDILSLDRKRCYDYHLGPSQRVHHKVLLVIDYTLKDTAIDDQSCPGPERHNGAAFIDPENMQVMRLEMHTPNHKISPGTYASWTWSIDYAPVVFDNEPFWMPTTITSRAEGITQRQDWSFVATYRNYHKLTVTSKILPDVDYNPKQ